MTVTIQKSTACGTVSAPPSKSMGHRLLISAALAEGESTITGIEYMERGYEDIVSKLKALGANIKRG